jgi:hypothetical protein
MPCAITRLRIPLVWAQFDPQPHSPASGLPLCCFCLFGLRGLPLEPLGNHPEDPLIPPCRLQVVGIMIYGSDDMRDVFIGDFHANKCIRFPGIIDFTFSTDPKHGRMRCNKKIVLHVMSALDTRAEYAVKSRYARSTLRDQPQSGLRLLRIRRLGNSPLGSNGGLSAPHPSYPSMIELPTIWVKTLYLIQFRCLLAGQTESLSSFPGRFVSRRHGRNGIDERLKPHKSPCATVHRAMPAGES